MKKYLKLIKNKNYSLIIVKKRKIVFSSNKRGLTSLLYAARNNLLEKAIVFDKTIGLAAAKICYWSKVDKIISLISSHKAISFLEKKGIEIITEKTVNKIINHKNKECSMEKTANKSNNFKDFLKNIKTLSEEITYKKAPKNGVFPENYYTTTNKSTKIKLNGKWIKVKHIEMDKGIKISKNLKTAQCIWGNLVKKGDFIVVGEENQGIKLQKDKISGTKNNFVFMSNNASSERSKETMALKIAKKMQTIKKSNGRILFVVGPAIIHTGAGKYLARLIKHGFVQILFSGNGLATHDLEENYYGTSLGINLKTGISTTNGHHKHLRVINLIRNHGSIKKTINKGYIKSGIIYESLKKKIDLVLCGSIRDDGPLPEVITDTQKSQEKMRSKIRKGVNLSIMIASTLHSIAAGNLLPAKVYKVIVDINPAIVTKLSDRGTNAYGIVTDAEYFLQKLCQHLDLIKEGGKD